MERQNYKYIAIEGNIGVGKTYLANKISSKLKESKLILEDYNNPILPKFYENSEKYSLLLEISLLLERYESIKNIINQSEFKILITDFVFDKSLIFSKINLNKEEFNLLNNLYNKLITEIPIPDMIIYLNLPINKIQEQIKKRGRIFEKNIPLEYLKKINNEYNSYLSNIHNINILRINNYKNIDSEISNNYKKIMNSITNLLKQKLIN